MDRFVALPVGQGDAFFLQHSTFSALVDGGRSVRQFPGLFSNHLEARHVNALVCTHNDADHANGVLGFLRSDLRCDEVWLPALWFERMRDLLETPNEFVNNLLNDVEEFNFPRGDGDSDHMTLDEVSESYVDEPRESPQSHDGPTPLEGLGRNDSGDSGAFIWNRYPDPRLSRHWWFLGTNKGRLFTEAMSAAKRIRAIAVACTHRNVPVRWFQYSPNLDHSSLEHSNEDLVPINAVQVAAVPNRRRSALHYVALSTANRLSLVFCSPRAEAWPGVLFTADSDLRFASIIPWNVGMIVTAPHHGSEANENAYSRAECEMEDASDLFWVRSDGNFTSRPGRSYCALPDERRFCTLCRQTCDQKQAVGFRINDGCWTPCASVRGCSCECPKQ